MRIIAGKARRLPLLAPAGKDTRPTTDRIKETLFNMLAPRLSGACFLDLFAGSGQIGLEAVSRGCERCVFVENDRRACAIIEENMRFTKLAGQCELMRADAEDALRRLAGRYRFDLVFMDPPYRTDAEAGALRALADFNLLRDDALVVVEADIHTDFSYVSGLGFRLVREKRYKTNKHVFLSPDMPGEGDAGRDYYEESNLSGEL